MKTHILNSSSEPVAMGRRSVLKTGGILLASQAVLGLSTNVYAGRNGVIDSPSMPDNSTPNATRYQFGSASAPKEAAAAKEVGVALLRPEDVQILFVDLQTSLVAASQTVKPQALAGAAGVLAKVGRILNIPMTFCVVPEPGRRATLVPELATYANENNTFSRLVASPFLEQAISARLASSRRKVLVIAGFSTEVAALQSTLGAIAAGYSVQVPVDAIGSRSERTEAAALRQMENAGATTTSVLSLATLLAPDFSQRPGSEVLSALAGLRGAD